MNQLLRVFMVSSLILVFVVLRSIRRQHVRVEYSVSWLIAAIIVFALSWMPWLLRRITALLGLNDDSTTLFFLVFLVFLGVFYRFSAILSDLKDMNIALSQKVALLEYQVRSRDA